MKYYIGIAVILLALALLIGRRKKSSISELRFPHKPRPRRFTEPDDTEGAGVGAKKPLVPVTSSGHNEIPTTPEE
jgi:hypothetical protein